MLQAPVSPTPPPAGLDELPTLALSKKEPASPAALAPGRAESIDDSFDPDATLAETSQTSQDALAKIFPTSFPSSAASKDPKPAPLAVSTPPSMSADDPDDEMPTTALPPLSVPASAAATASPPKDSKSPAAPIAVPGPRAKPSVPPPTPASAKPRSVTPPQVTPAGPLSPLSGVSVSSALDPSVNELPTVAVAATVLAPRPPERASADSVLDGSVVSGEISESLPGVPAETPPPPALAPTAARSNFPATHTPSPFEDSPGVDSGVFTKSLMGDEVSPVASPAAAPASGPGFPRADSPDVYTRTVADAQAILPSEAPSRASQGRPSDVLPRPPASSVVQAPSPSSSISVMPSAYALEGPGAQYQRPATPPPSGYPGTPASYGGYPGTPAPPSGYTSTPRPPTYKPTPPPPGGYGPPPALDEGSYPVAALDSLGGDPARAESANTVWRQAHPSATRWAAKRSGSAAVTPRPGIIALGLMLAGLGAYLLLIFLPSKAPLTAAAHEQLMHQAGVDEQAWHFTAKLMSVATVNAALFVLLGVVVLLQGALHRQGPARRKKMSKASVLLVSCFGLLSVSFVALLLAASMR